MITVDLLLLSTKLEALQANAKVWNERCYDDDQLVDDTFYPSGGRHRRSDKDGLWPNATLIFDIDQYAFNVTELALIHSPMDYIENKTCVKFRRRKNHSSFVRITNGTVCDSRLGYRGMGSQRLFLEKPRCMDKGSVIHELLHALGLVHEHMRPDRDEYIKVHFDNIAQTGPFSKLPLQFTEDRFAYFNDEPYDPYSVMHYHWNHFAINKSKPTITSKQCIPNHELGKADQDGKMTHLDIRKVNKHYNCHSFLVKNMSYSVDKCGELDRLMKWFVDWFANVFLNRTFGSLPSIFMVL